MQKQYPHLRELLLHCNSKDLVDRWSGTQNAQFLAVDAEMIVTTTEPSCLARIACTDPVNVKFHSFVKPRGQVKDYLTHITGLTESALSDATWTHKEVRDKIMEFLTPDTIWVGHDCAHDFRSLGISTDDILILDTSKIFRYAGFQNYIPALGDLSYIFLGVSIHEKGFPHDPRIDALASWHLAEFALEHGIQEIDPVPDFILKKWGLRSGALYEIQEVPSDATWADVEKACNSLGTVRQIKLEASRKAEVEFQEKLPPSSRFVDIKGKRLSLLATSLPRKRKRNLGEEKEIRKRVKVPSTPELEAMIAKRKMTFTLDLDLRNDSEFQITHESSDEE